MFTTRKAAIAVMLGSMLVLPAAGAHADGPPGHPVQLELGDSWTYGDGASVPATTGYAGKVFASNLAEPDCTPAAATQAKDGCKHLQRAIHARPGTADNPGVTTDAMLAEQMKPATTLLTDRNTDANPHNDVEVVLVSVGGNDVSGPVLDACLGGLAGDCVGVIRERLAHVQTNLDDILTDLRSAAGGEATIVITTYDNAIAHCPIGQLPGASQLGALVLEGNPALGLEGLNNVIRSTAARHGVDVADTYGKLGAGQWVGDCLHPNDDGYATIAEIVSGVIDD
jgi:lysophospholipase L1-like esterase